MREKKEKKMRETRQKEGELQFCQHIFLLDLGPIFIYTYSNLSLTYYRILFLRLD